MRTDVRSKSRGQTCLYYALQGGGQDCEAGLKEKGEIGWRMSVPHGISPFSFLLSHFPKSISPTQENHHIIN